jgi:hypothetical protein
LAPFQNPAATDILGEILRDIVNPVRSKKSKGQVHSSSHSLALVADLNKPIFQLEIRNTGEVLCIRTNHGKGVG